MTVCEKSDREGIAVCGNGAQRDHEDGGYPVQHESSLGCLVVLRKEPPERKDALNRNGLLDCGCVGLDYQQEEGNTHLSMKCT